jgi:hypothetical protein
MNPVLQRINLENSLDLQNIFNLENFFSISENSNAFSSLLSAPVHFNDLTSLGGFFIKKNHNEKKDDEKEDDKKEIKEERRERKHQIRDEYNIKFAVSEKGGKRSIFTFRNLFILILILIVLYYFLSPKKVEE